MSVIGLNLWINFQVLKSTFEQVQAFVSNKLRDMNKQMAKFQQDIVSKLIKQVNVRDEIISSLRANQEIQSFNLSSKTLLSNMKQDIDLQQRCQQLLIQNKEYQDELQSLIGQLKCIKVYIQELKKAKCNREEILAASPAKKLEFQQQENQILTKISSLSRFQSINIDSRLETIKEQQSEKSVKSYSSKQQEQQQELFVSYPSFQNKIQSRLAQSTSFECTSEIIDIKNTLFDNNSQQNSQQINPLQETIQHSLCVLKNYSNLSNQKQSASFSKKRLPFQSLKLLSMPTLRVDSVINERHIVFEKSYIYTGSTVRFNQIEVKPMGFGQLYSQGNLLYCGEWKNGCFDGWGKMFFDNQSKIRNFNGKWEKGIPSGPCSIKFWNNQKFIGTMKSGVIEGEGSYYSKSELVWRGVWQNNRLRKNQI